MRRTLSPLLLKSSDHSDTNNNDGDKWEVDGLLSNIDRDS
jgi:hypothetical protein